MKHAQTDAENEAARWAKTCLRNATEHLGRHTEFPFPETDVHLTVAALFMIEAMQAIEPHVFQSTQKDSQE